MKKLNVCIFISVLMLGIFNTNAMTLEQFMAENNIVTEVTVYHYTPDVGEDTPDMNDRGINLGEITGEIILGTDEIILNQTTDKTNSSSSSDITNSSDIAETAEEDTSDEESTQDTEETDQDTGKEFVIKDIELKDINGNKVNSLQNASNLSKIFVAKKTSTVFPATILIALYDGNRLLDLKLADIDETHEANGEIAYNINMSITNVNTETTLKVMIWDIEESLKPYSNPLSVSYGYTIDVSVTASQEYTIPIVPNSQARIFKVTYDNSILSIKDLCKETEGNTTTIGIVNDKITITEVTENSFTFSFTSEENIECINRIVMEATKTGNTTIQIEELAE